jgi:hypothetical protein
MKTIRFYTLIGFELHYKDETIAVLRKDNCAFFLQNISNDWAQNNFMMSMEVENLDDWWKKLHVLKLEENYEGVKLKAPENYPWGKREIHLIDPCGVLRHIGVHI